MKRRERFVLTLASVFVLSHMQGFAQERRGELVGSLHYYASSYSGEFISDGFTGGATVNLAYGLSDRLWLEGRVGFGGYGWQTNSSLMAKYDEYYGANPAFGGTYPGTLSRIESNNASTLRLADILLGYALTRGSFTPFITAGVGMVNVQPRTASAGEMLPNFEKGVYAATAASIPVGVGIRFSVSEHVAISFRGEYRMVFSGYLDDVAVRGIDDGLYAASAGVSYSFNAPSAVLSSGPYWCELCNVQYNASTCAICAVDNCPICARARAQGAMVPPGPQADAQGTLAQGPTSRNDGAEETPRSPEVTPAESAGADKPDDAPATDDAQPTQPDSPSKKNDEPVAPKAKRRLTAPGIRFNVDTEQINFNDPSTRANLNEILEYLRESCEDLRVMIEGHASSEGPAARNQELSVMRAREVAKWLYSQGIPQERIQGAVGFGSSMPRVPEPSPAVARRMSKEQLEAIREQNRRIELEILEDCE